MKKIPFDRITQEIAEHGISITPDFLPAPTILDLETEARNRVAMGQLKPAGVGTKANKIDAIRGDMIDWISDEKTNSPALDCYLEAIESLRSSLNQSLMLGLFSVETHFALYPPGSHYKKHLDQFREKKTRAISSILYLNQAWKDEHGGQLRVYLDEDTTANTCDILPTGGTMVTFLSDRFWHEVLPASRERLSITGWMRTRDIL